jgi:repressor LexA
MFNQKEDLNKREKEAVRILRNYIMHKGELPTVRELMSELGYKSPRSASEIIEKLIVKGILQKKLDGGLKFMDIQEMVEDRADTIDVPVVGDVACGRPILAEENITALIPVSLRLAKPPHKYFFLRAKGNSMNEKGINDGDLVLIRQQNTAYNGDLVVALIDDEATIKEFIRTEGMVILKPRSTDKTYQPIVLTSDFQVQGVVIKSLNNI